jgi:hypothetical protein
MIVTLAEARKAERAAKRSLAHRMSPQSGAAME